MLQKGPFYRARRVEVHEDYVDEGEGQAKTIENQTILPGFNVIAVSMLSSRLSRTATWPW